MRCYVDFYIQHSIQTKNDNSGSPLALSGGNYTAFPPTQGMDIGRRNVPRLTIEPSYAIWVAYRTQLDC